jgi:hypothetical protein
VRFNDWHFLHSSFFVNKKPLVNNQRHGENPRIAVLGIKKNIERQAPLTVPDVEVPARKLQYY